jgi:aldose 1-epimerase
MGLRLVVLLLLGSAMTASADVKKSAFGKTAAGEPVERYTLTSKNLEVDVITYGARLARVRAPDKRGKLGDVVLGHDTVAGYEQDRKTYLGAIVGRYGNRIAKGRFTLDGKSYQIPANNGPNALHGGPEGFDRKLWSAKEVPEGVELTLVSPDGEMGFPGKLTAVVRYTLSGESLRVAYSVSSDKPTVVNLTNHAYFNLRGQGDILGHELMLAADRYTPVDEGLIPTGELQPVAGTPLDFQKPIAIGKRIGDAHEQLTRGRGYDHNWVLSGGEAQRVAARVHEPTTGRVLTVTTTEPGVQFYSGNFLDGTSTGRGGVVYAQRTGFCLETQHFPDSPNRPAFPSTVLRPGKPRTSETIFTFTVQR